MIKRICDRCNQEIQSNYWTISIYEKEDATIRVTAAGAANNLAQNINRMFNKEKEYCKECIEEISKFINKKEEQQWIKDIDQKEI